MADAQAGSRVARCASSSRGQSVYCVEVLPIRVTVAEQHVHDRAGERPVGAGLDEEGEVRLPHGGVVVDVDDDDLRAALLSRPDRVGHHVDLRVDRVRAPDHDAVGDTHLARIGARELARAGNPAGPGHVGADRRELAGVALGVAEPIDAVAHHKAHRSGVVVRPHRLGPDRPFGRQERLGGEVERLVPGDAPELARALRPDPPQRVRQPIRMMDPLGIARDLGADDAGRVAVVLRRHAPGRWCARRSPRRRGRRSRGSHAGRSSAGVRCGAAHSCAGYAGRCAQRKGLCAVIAGDVHRASGRGSGRQEG